MNEIFESGISIKSKKHQLSHAAIQTLLSSDLEASSRKNTMTPLQMSQIIHEPKILNKQFSNEYYTDI